MKHLMLLSLLSIVASFQNPTYAKTSEEETNKMMQSASPSAAAAREISSERRTDSEEKVERRPTRNVPHHQGGLEDR